jgi:hypothetical protein
MSQFISHCCAIPCRMLSSDGPDLSIQNMSCLWKTRAGWLCPCARWRISYKLLHMHGMSPRDISHSAFSHTRQDCGDVVVSKFFPIEGPDATENPLCERDYFRRLNLVCEKCGMALRGNYVTACSQSQLHPSAFIPFLNFSCFFSSIPPQTKNITLDILLAPSALPYSAHRTLTMNTTAMYIAISTTQSAFPQNAPAAHAPSSSSLSK